MKNAATIYPLLLSILLLAFLSNCKKGGTLQTLPTVTTDPVTDIVRDIGTGSVDIGSPYAILGGKVTSEGGSPVTQQGVCYSGNQNPNLNDIKLIDNSGANAFSFKADVSYGSTYYIRAFAINAAGTAFGNQVTLSTSVLIPVVTTTTVTALTETTATGSGVVSYSVSPVTGCGACWSTSHNPTIANNKTSDVMNEYGYFTSSITGLVPNTAYYLRAYATNSAGTGYGNEVSFAIDQASGPTVSDFDGNLYHTVTIGTQTWMVENLKTTKYRYGTPIPNVTDATAWGDLTSDAYCNFNNDTDIAKTNGRLYNWYAVNSGELAPAGWHIPSDAEWTTLTNWLTNNGYGYEGSGNDIAKSIAARSGWYPSSQAGNVGNDQAGNNRSGFTALPCGHRYYETGMWSGFAFEAASVGLWWSSTGNTTGIISREPLVTNGSYIKTTGLSVRCLKD